MSKDSDQRVNALAAELAAVRQDLDALTSTLWRERSNRQAAAPTPQRPADRP